MLHRSCIELHLSGFRSHLMAVHEISVAMETQACAAHVHHHHLLSCALASSPDTCLGHMYWAKSTQAATSATPAFSALWIPGHLAWPTKSFCVMRLVMHCRSADAVRLADRYARPSATCRDLQCWPPWVHAQAAFFAGDLLKVRCELESMSVHCYFAPPEALIT